MRLTGSKSGQIARFFVAPQISYRLLPLIAALCANSPHAMASAHEEGRQSPNQSANTWAAIAFGTDSLWGNGAVKPSVSSGLDGPTSSLFLAPTMAQARPYYPELRVSNQNKREKNGGNGGSDVSKFVAGRSSLPTISHFVVLSPAPSLRVSNPVGIAPIADTETVKTSALALIQDSLQEKVPSTSEAPSTVLPMEVPAESNADLQARLDALAGQLEKIGTAELEPITLILPGISSNVPTALGAGWGMAAFGFGYQDGLRTNQNRDDGTAAIVIGLSDPQKLGVDIQVSALDLSRFGHRVALGFKLHRQLTNDYSVAFGGENTVVRPDSDSPSSYYAVVSKTVRLAESSSQPLSRLYLSAGLGNGRFNTNDNIFRDRGKVNVFGSAAINLTRSATTFAEWTGQSVNLGASFVPLRKYPFVLTLALADVAGGGGSGTRFTAGFGYVLAR